MSKINIPEQGKKISINDSVLDVPNNPIVPYIEGDGTGSDIWKATVNVINSAVEKAYNGEKKIHWMEIYAGEKSNNDDNIDLLLDRMSKKTNRKAYFHCSLIYLDPKDTSNPILIETQWHGTICNERSGDEGFGYDPVFFIPKLGKTAAELSIQEKNKCSHRGQAMTLLIERLIEDNLISRKEN